jgi:hypothetical protein
LVTVAASNPAAFEKDGDKAVQAPPAASATITVALGKNSGKIESVMLTEAAF